MTDPAIWSVETGDARLTLVARAAEPSGVAFVAVDLGYPEGGVTVMLSREQSQQLIEWLSGVMESPPSRAGSRSRWSWFSG